jgi:DNA-binding MarR family transcriptional regulator
MPQVHALMFIFHAGECQVSDIGKLADASKAAASQMAERLVQQGLVERKEDPSNRRIKKLRLTEKGKKMILDSFTSNPFLTDKLASLTTEERNAVHAAFSLLARNDQHN